MKRNPEACCRNCPYFQARRESVHGDCQITNQSVEKYDLQWCGQHPDFWSPKSMIGKNTYPEGNSHAKKS